MGHTEKYRKPRSKKTMNALELKSAMTDRIRAQIEMLSSKVSATKDMENNVDYRKEMQEERSRAEKRKRRTMLNSEKELSHSGLAPSVISMMSNVIDDDEYSAGSCSNASECSTVETNSQKRNPKGEKSGRDEKKAKKLKKKRKKEKKEKRRKEEGK